MKRNEIRISGQVMAEKKLNVIVVSLLQLPIFHNFSMPIQDLFLGHGRMDPRHLTYLHTSFPCSSYTLLPTWIMSTSHLFLSMTKALPGRRLPRGSFLCHSPKTPRPHSPYPRAIPHAPQRPWRRPHEPCRHARISTLVRRHRQWWQNRPVYLGASPRCIRKRLSAR